MDGSEQDRQYTQYRKRARAAEQGQTESEKNLRWRVCHRVMRTNNARHCGRSPLAMQNERESKIHQLGKIQANTAST